MLFRSRDPAQKGLSIPACPDAIHPGPVAGGWSMEDGVLVAKAGGTIWTLVIVPHALHSSSSTPSPPGAVTVSWLPQTGHSKNSNVPSSSGPRHPAWHQYACLRENSDSTTATSRPPTDSSEPPQWGQLGRTTSDSAATTPTSTFPRRGHAAARRGRPWVHDASWLVVSPTRSTVPTRGPTQRK